MKNIKLVAVIVTLSLAIVFLLMDKCGSSRKVDELKGQYEEASQIAKVERLIKEEIIKEQQEKIEVLNTTIAVKNTTIAKKEKNNAKLDESVRYLEQSFDKLDDKDKKIENLTKQISLWREKFGISQSIIADKDDVIFSLTAQYEAQLVISNAYKTMYDTLTLNTRKLQKIVTAQDWQIKRLKLTGGLKSGLVLVLAVLIVYNMVK